MPLEFENSFGAAALDQQQTLDREQGFAVIPGTSGLGTECEATVNTGTLGTGNNALSVASGSVLFDGSVTSVSQQSVDIDAGDSDPRKDVVYIDSNGAAQVKKGSPASVPSAAPGERFQTWKPAPYDMHDIDGVVLAVVWVAANASSVTSGDVRDRRLPADETVNELAAQTVTTDGLVVDDTHHWASQYDGGDPDARLANALSAASDGDVIHLENGTYDSNLTVSKRLRVVGTNPGGTSPSGTQIGADWTIGEGIHLSDFILDTGQSITITGRRSTLSQFRAAGTAAINVNADECRVYGMFDGNLTFDSGTTGGIIDASIGVSVTDNGTNTEGNVG